MTERLTWTVPMVVINYLVLRVDLYFDDLKLSS